MLEQHTLDTLAKISPYALKQLKKQETAILALLQEKNAWHNYNYQNALNPYLEEPNENTFMKQLRLAKHRYQSAFIIDKLKNKTPEQNFMKALSKLAQALIETALKWQEKRLQTRHGIPKSQNHPQSLTVLGMGKLGGYELNFSSDIDLIFCYRENGQTHAEEGQKSIENEIYFRKLAQKLIYTLDHITEDGFIYRVDMRLRPFGDSGALALSQSAMETYYQLHGRDWERYALMKARPIAGDIEGGKQLLKTLRPFIYRRYLDYAALDNIAAMKENINQQIQEKGMENHIKLGKGGIREAEFSVQAMQLIYGGQYPKLQTPNFLSALEDLQTLNFWQQTDTIKNAYLLLRQVENALQFAEEQQTHNLPENENDWQKLALACQQENSQTLKQALNHARHTIHQTFKQLFKEEEKNQSPNPFQFHWQKPNKEKLTHTLKQQNYPEQEAQNIAQTLENFSQKLPWQRLPAKTTNSIEKLLPKLLQNASQSQKSAKSISAVLNLIETVALRAAYIDMLTGEEKLLKHLLNIAEQSAWLIRFICQHPLVIDDILSERHYLNSPQSLNTDLKARLTGIAHDDEQWLHAIRDFKHAQIFKIAWAEINQQLPLMQASDKLSQLAELILKTAYEKSYNSLKEKYGEPRSQNGAIAEFCIIAYGKLGGLELAYTSDLDLVFLYDDAQSQGQTDGKKSIANAVFFTRLAQRIQNLLSSPSTSGVLYEIDTRLRPGGRSGMLVASIEAFEKYQYQNAWTWEHQALVRTRPIAGNKTLQQKFKKLRQNVLSQAPKATLKEDVLNMRQKMHDATTIPSNKFHLKKSSGGLIDIEFIVQYLILKHAHQEPILLRMSDNIRQLAALEATGLLSSHHAMTLRDSYRRLRQAAHRRALNDENNLTNPEKWQEIRQNVQNIWQHIFQ